MSAVEIDPVAGRSGCPRTVAPARTAGARPTALDRGARPTRCASTDPARPAPTALVANLPYNVSVPVLLHLLATFPSIARSAGDGPAGGGPTPGRPARLAGSYGVPSAKARWFGDVRQAGLVGAHGLLAGAERRLRARRDRRAAPPPRTDVERAEVFAVVDAAFAQRRKMLRSALAAWAGGTSRATALLEQVGLAPTTRAEQLDIGQFAALAAAATPAALSAPGGSL